MFYETSLEDNLRLVCNNDSEDIHEKIALIDQFVDGDFNYRISPRCPNIILLIFWRLPIQKKEIDLCIECIKRGANPNYLYGGILAYLNNYEHLKIIFTHGYNPNTTIYHFPTLNVDCEYPILHYTRFTRIAYLFLLYGANPSLVFDARKNLLNKQTIKMREENMCDVSINHIVTQAVKMEPIVKTVKSFVLATCVDDIDFKETMMESLWPRLKYYLFSEFY